MSKHSDSRRNYDTLISTIMEIRADENLFWYMPKGTLLDLSDPSVLDAYAQQVLCRGRAHHVESLLKTVDQPRLQASLQRIRHFLPPDVAGFWEECLGTHL